jgi:hypothetical protein
MSDKRERCVALILQALDDMDRERAGYMTEYKDRRVKLENQLAQLRNEILSGQLTLVDAMEKTADLVNAGALNTKDVKVTAEVKQA